MFCVSNMVFLRNRFLVQSFLKCLSTCPTVVVLYANNTTSIWSRNSLVDLSQEISDHNNFIINYCVIKFSTMAGACYCGKCENEIRSNAQLVYVLTLFHKGSSGITNTVFDEIVLLAKEYRNHNWTCTNCKNLRQLLMMYWHQSHKCQRRKAPNICLFTNSSNNEGHIPMIARLKD